MRRGQPIDLPERDGLVRAAVERGERDPRARACQAGEPAHRQPYHHRIAGQREISQAALVAAMHPRRGRAAARTHRAHTHRPRLEHHAIDGSPHPLHHDATQVRQQNIKTGKIAPRSAITVHKGQGADALAHRRVAGGTLTRRLPQFRA
ncbi:hypothetical protein Psuf_010410 [Phytohabitans suffuscus]|uniref:Uncharacterized protein n=1 Tax=Phytohabitans suffuscus TaxID=624315 RepID=A0A6F8YCM5_9ACTN|nr:hypothetical protein Psuf_010410 [Phytohabitans suffuscus]